MGILRTVLQPVLRDVFRVPFDGLGAVAWVYPTDIPAAEAAELKKLYELTDGPNWTNNTGWGTSENAADYFGVDLYLSTGRVWVINLSNNALNGNISDFDPSVFTTPTFYLYLNNNAAVSGNIAGWTLPSGLKRLYTYLSDGFSSDLAGMVVNSAMEVLRLHYCNFTGVPDLSGTVNLQRFDINDNGLSATDINAIVDSLYIAAPNWTYTSGIIINIAGSNAAPSGTYQAASPPTTALEKIYDMVVDPNNLYNPITITYTAP